MNHPTASGLYRVRTVTHGEQIVAMEIGGPRFDCLDAATSYASSLVDHKHLSVIVEKLAPSGCWLQLSSLG